MRSLPVFGRLLHFLDHVLAGSEVDKRCSAQLLHAHLLLLGAGVDGDDVQAHGFSVLLGERSEAAAGTDDGDGLAGFGAGLFQALVNCDAGAEDGGDCVEGDVFVEAGDVGSFGDAVLLEGTVDGVAGEESFGAERFVWIVG